MIDVAAIVAYAEQVGLKLEPWQIRVLEQGGTG